MVISLLIKTQCFITCWTLKQLGGDGKSVIVLAGTWEVCTAVAVFSWLPGEGVLHRCSVKSKDTEAFCIPMWGWQAVCEAGIE